LLAQVAAIVTPETYWGYRRIQGASANLGHDVVRGTIANILKKHGIEPALEALERSGKTTWKEFLSRYWELLVAAEFFTVEAWTRRGLQQFLVLFFIELSTEACQSECGECELA
jgi:hypothetical protein